MIADVLCRIRIARPIAATKPAICCTCQASTSAQGRVSSSTSQYDCCIHRSPLCRLSGMSAQRIDLRPDALTRVPQRRNISFERHFAVCRQHAAGRTMERANRGGPRGLRCRSGVRSRRSGPGAADTARSWPAAPEILGRPAREHQRQRPVEPRKVGDRRHHTFPAVEARCLRFRQCLFENHDYIRTCQKKLPRRFQHSPPSSLQVGSNIAFSITPVTACLSDLDRQGSRPRKRRDKSRLARTRYRQAPHRLAGRRDPWCFRDPFGDHVGIKTLKRRRRDDARRIYAPVRGRPERLYFDRAVARAGDRIGSERLIKSPADPWQAWSGS